MKFNLFKRTKVDNAADLESSIVELPKSKIEKTFLQLVNESDDSEMAKKEEMPMANMDHHVDVDGAKMKLNELVDKHREMCQAYNALKEESDKAKAANEPSEEEKKKKADEEAKMNDDKKKLEEEHEKKMNELKDKHTKELEDLKTKQTAFEQIKNADTTAGDKTVVVETSQDQVARGSNRYGSSK